MLQPLIYRLCKEKIILASGSPRRKEILQQVGLKFDVVPSTFEENLDKQSFECPSDYVQETARLKALEVAARMKKEQRDVDLIIAADTVVTMDDKIFEKPFSKQNAIGMLQGFSGRTHTVYTGVVLLRETSNANVERCAENRVTMTHFHCATDVKFADLSQRTIEAYVDTGEPMDKAGGYGIQALGGSLIEAIHGDYYNVVGFPLHLFCQHLLRLYDGELGDTLGKPTDDC